MLLSARAVLKRPVVVWRGCVCVTVLNRIGYLAKMLLPGPNIKKNTGRTVMEKRKHGSAEARVSTLVAEAPDVAAPRADACATLRRAGRLARPSMTARARARFGAPRLKNAVRSGNMLPSGDDRNNPKWPDTLSETTRERRRRRVPRSASELVHARGATGCPQRVSSARLGRG